MCVPTNIHIYIHTSPTLTQDTRTNASTHLPVYIHKFILHTYTYTYPHGWMIIVFGLVIQKQHNLSSSFPAFSSALSCSAFAWIRLRAQGERIRQRVYMSAASKACQQLCQQLVTNVSRLGRDCAVSSVSIRTFVRVKQAKTNEEPAN